MTGSRSTRAKRRGAALAALGQLAPLVHRHRVNDRKGAHITLWLTVDARLEWWPGSQRWRCHEDKTHFGDADEFVAFITNARLAHLAVKLRGPGVIDPRDPRILRRPQRAA